MIQRLLYCSIGKSVPDDRDSYLNKRVDLTGTLLNNLFRNYFNKLVKDMQKQIRREINTGSWKSTEDFTQIVNLRSNPRKLLERLARNTPTDLWFEYLKIDGDKKIQILGSAFSYKDIGDFIISANESLTYWNNSPDNLDIVYFHLYQNGFQISCLYLQYFYN